jgi:hypothetical protein
LLAINFVFIAYLWVGIAGFTADRKFSSSLFSNVVYKPWVSLIWKYTNLYSPMPEIFVERSLGHEVDPVLDTYLPIRSREREDGFSRILAFDEGNTSSPPASVCPGKQLLEVQGNVERLYAPSAPITERKLIYFAGNFNCR